MPPRLIAEYKRRSPWLGHITDIPPEEAVERMLDLDPSMLSVIVDPGWGGSYRDLETIRERTALPILAKGLRVDEAVARDAGADWVLSPPGCPVEIPALTAWECHTEEDVQMALGDEGILLLNNRSLVTGELKRGNVDKLLPLIPEGRVTIAASGYRVGDDYPDTDYVLIGTSLWLGEKEEEA